MPIGLLGLHRYFASGSRGWLLVFAAAYLLAGLSNGYYLYFFLLPIGVVIVVELLRPRLPRRRILGDLSVAAVGIAAVLAPIVFVYFRVQQAMRFTRDPDLLAGYSAALSDYFRVGGGAWNWGGLLPGGHVERHLFHGFAVMIFAVVGVCTGAARERDEGSADSWRRTVINLRLYRRARRMALNGARTLATVRMALPPRSGFQRDAGPRAVGVHRHPRARRARGRGVRPAVRSLVSPMGRGRGDGIRRRDRPRRTTSSRRTRGSGVARTQLGPRRLHLAAQQSSRRSARVGDYQDELLSNDHDVVSAARARASTSHCQRVLRMVDAASGAAGRAKVAASRARTRGRSRARSSASWRSLCAPP
jgi:hypothetical protein